MEKRDPTKPFFFWNGNTSTALHQWKNDQQDWSQEKLASVRVPPELPDSNAVRSSLLGYYQGVRRMDADAGACITELTNRKLLDDTLVIYLSDNGWQQPRGLANCYDSGTHVPMAMRWGNRLTAGRTVDEFVSLTDLAPTLLEIAGLPALVEMTGSSFVDLMMGKASSQSRDHVFLERERHANVRRGNLSYPIRGIRTKDFLYLWNMRPDRWPAGDPVVYMAVGDYGDVDDSLSKNDILMNQVSPQVQRSFELCFAKRPEEELFDLRNDASQIINVADRPDYAAVKKALRQKVEQWMRDTQDPRVDPNHNGWDNYAYYGGSAIGRGKEKAPKASGQ